MKQEANYTHFINEGKNKRDVSERFADFDNWSKIISAMTGEDDKAMRIKMGD